MRRLLLTSLGPMLLASCTWVDLTESGENVAVVAELAENCERLGSSDTVTQRDIGFIDRNGDKVRSELETLARNAAARMGGDTVIAETEISENGEQRFGVYRCR